MGVLTGNVRTDQVLAQKVAVNMREKIDMLDSQPNFFEYLSRQFRGGVTGVESMKYEYMEMTSYPCVMTCNAVTAAGQTAISVDHPEYAHTDQMIFNTRTKEWYLMNEATGGTGSSGKITVVNQTGSGGSTYATAVGDVLLIGPEAHAEGEAVPAAYSQTPRYLYRYLFQHDKRRANTDIQRATKEYGIKQLIIDRKMFWMEEMRALAINLYASKQGREVTSASGPRRHQMSGLMEQITSNVVDFDLVPGNMTLASIGEILRKTMEHSSSSDTKVGICGQNAWAAISAMPENAIRTSVSEASWGKRLKTLISPYGNLAVGYDLILSQTYGLADKVFVLDPAYIERLEVVGEHARLLLNVQDSTDIHNQVDFITGTDGLRVGLEELHAYAENVA